MSNLVLSAYRIKWLLSKIDARTPSSLHLSQSDIEFLEHIDKLLNMYNKDLVLKGSDAVRLEKLAT